MLDLITVAVGLVYLVVVGGGMLGEGKVVNVNGKGINSVKRIDESGMNEAREEKVGVKTNHLDMMAGNLNGNSTTNGNGKGSHALRKKKSRSSLRDAGMSGL